MRTSTLSLLTAAIALSFLAGCTVKDVDAPAFSGPSSLARTILMTVDRDTLVQNGEDEATITLRAQVPPGESENIRLRAQVFVDGVAQDFGTLSNKTPITPTTIRYRAPASSLLPAGQVPQTVTIAVTPFDQGDFRGEVSRTVDIRLVPQGVILPTNPALIPAFTFTPTSPKVLDTVSFNASTTTNGGTACASACSYGWTFGDGTSGSGVATTHDYRTSGSFQVVLTVTDSRGAQATAVQLVTVAPGTPPEATFTFSPQPALVNQDIFFNAEASVPAPGRRIVGYGWNFGDGRTASGVTVARSYANTGTFIVTLRVTDDAGATSTATETVLVTNPQPVPQFTVLPASPAVGELVSFNASSTTGPSPITTYSWSFGANSSPATATGVSVTTTYSAAGNKLVTLTVVDAAGRTATITKTVIVPVP